MKKVLNIASSAGQTWGSPGRRGWKDVRRNGGKSLEGVQRNGEKNSGGVRNESVFGFLMAARSWV